MEAADPTGETPSISSRVHRDKHTCYEEVRTVMAEQHPSADIQVVAFHGVRVASPAPVYSSECVEGSLQRHLALSRSATSILPRFWPPSGVFAASL